MIFFSRIIIIFIAMESMQHFIVIVLNSPNCTSPLTGHIQRTAMDSAHVLSRSHHPALSSTYCQYVFFWNMFSQGVLRAVGAELLAA